MAGVPLAGGVSPSIHDTRSVRGPDPCRDRHSRTDGDGAAWRVHAADRLFRLSRRLAGVRLLRKQSLPVMRRGFDDHADLCRRARRSGRVRLAGIFGAGCGAGADGRAFARRRRNVPAGLDRGSSLDSGDDRLPCRHFGAHPHFPIACHPRLALACWPNAVASGDARRTFERNKPVYACDRSRRAGDHRAVRADQRAYSRRIDRPRLGERGRGVARVGKPRRQRSRCGRRGAAGGCDPGYSGGAPREPRDTQSHHLGCRHGSDRGNHAILSVGPRSAAGCRSRFRRRRSRQYPVGTDRRISGQC